MADDKHFTEVEASSPDEALTKAKGDRVFSLGKGKFRVYFDKKK